MQGDWSRGYIWNDGWTFATEVSGVLTAGCFCSMLLADGRFVVLQSNARSAQFEHQILITEHGADVLTRRRSE